MRRKLWATAVALCGAMSTGAALAHHSFAAEFDSNAPIELTGTVTKIDWANPHAYFYIDVAGKKGDIENWAMELGSPNGLMRRGWTRDSMKIGDVVTVSGWRAKDGAPKGNARSVTLSTGKKLFAGSSQESGDGK